MPAKYIVCLQELHFDLDPNRHTVNQVTEAKSMTDRRGSEWFGSLKVAVVECLVDANDLIRQQIMERVKSSWVTLDPKDFSFTLSYTEIKDGVCWLVPCISDMERHRLVL